MARDFPFVALSAPLGLEARRDLAGALGSLLSWQRTLAAWPEALSAPDATPIVSLYRHGELAGCAGLDEGPPGQRLARAFLAALGDVRFGGVDIAGREALIAQVSYARSPRRLSVERALDEIEVGVEGALLLRADGRPAMLLPDVARDHHLGPEEFLEALAAKAETPRSKWPADGLWSFRTERVIARQRAPGNTSDDARARAVSWLCDRVERSGTVGFGLDPRDGTASAPGLLWHGRAAIAVRALDAHPLGHTAAARARRWLAREIGDGLAGRQVTGWPETRAMVAGTVALAALAGVELEAELHQLARESELAEEPWHAAQVVAALGPAAPAELFQSCVADLQTRTWAPWTALAAHRRGAFEVFERAIRGLVAGVRGAGPHEGGVGPFAVPELGRTAASVEALALADAADARAAVQRGRAFLTRHQLGAECYPLAAEPAWCAGAFPVSPVHDYLQTDVTAHAVLALGPP